MRLIKVKEGQTLLDIALEWCGDVSAVWDVAALNGKAITDSLTIGETLEVPAIMDEEMVAMFGPAWLKPASAEDLDAESFLDEGLEFWIIEDDFVIT